MQMPKTRSHPSPEDHRVTVLLIDDQVMIAEAIRRALSSEEDINFHYCPDPQKAIRLAGEINATVILQDLVMPDIDGLMMVRSFRVNRVTAKIPIIVLSTNEEAKVKSEAFQLGANDYLIKLPDKIEPTAPCRSSRQLTVSPV
jgi:PleD family two-component response regulator